MDLSCFVGGLARCFGAKAGRRLGRRWRASIAVVLLPAAALLALLAPPAVAIETSARQAFLIDMHTGTVLLEKNADDLMPPASMSKVMTVYLVFDRLKKGRIKLDDTLTVSESAWKRGGAASGGSTMFLHVGDRVRIEDLLHGVIVQSGNDASIVLAEGLAGTEEAFAEEMTRKAREIGMANSTFHNASGLPDPGHLTTARDLATLAKHTIEDFPEYYPFYAEREFAYGGIRQGNRNPLLYKSAGVDGLKTGHTLASGYGLTASARRGERRLILVLNGLPNMQVRADEAGRLFEYGFREFENYRLFKAGEEVARADVWYGKTPQVPLVGVSDVVVTLPRKARGEMKVAVAFDGPVPAPIRKGDRIASLRITAPAVAPLEVPLVAGVDVDELGALGRMVFTVRHFVDTLLN